MCIIRIIPKKTGRDKNKNNLKKKNRRGMKRNLKNRLVYMLHEEKLSLHITIKGELTCRSFKKFSSNLQGNCQSISYVFTFDKPKFVHFPTPFFFNKYAEQLQKINNNRYGE